MSVKDGRDYLYLVWKSEKSGKKYIVGELSKNGQFEFRYFDEVQSAIDDGFALLVNFPDINAVYTRDILFPVFSSRLPDKKRKDIHRILKKYGLQEFDSYLLIKRSGARLPIDNFEFIDPILNLNEEFSRIFNLSAMPDKANSEDENTIEVSRGDEVFLKPASAQENDENTVAVYTREGVPIGSVPRYYAAGVTDLLRKNRRMQCFIYNVGNGKNYPECVKLILKVY